MKIKEKDVPKILQDDGIEIFITDLQNAEVNSIPSLVKTFGESVSWAVTMVNTLSNSATLISQMPGQGNRMHYHEDWDEWWYIVSGKWRITFGTYDQEVGEGDVVMIKRGKKHKIEAIGDKPAIRLAVSRYDVNHIYEEEDEAEV